MGLYPRIKGPHLLTRAVRMKESRFLTVFVNCHPEDTAGKLMEYYSTLKPEKRLAESSRGLPRRDSPSEITSPSEKGAPFVCPGGWLFMDFTIQHEIGWQLCK
ncbi:mitochondrial transcription termination factor family protein [Musa troglodytarum]|uniref:Mitochondrial transcription termination factor family protein n=1 Tax=Musa troglodytarum TaxID=320322 RepID=A0A9E7E995_9LILI|nr:mitochondrial transcription termination factor family protein [Musa troglodytarum]URD72756.1 mitochondrial transcription termination factor family protein [Musa troglodytarum]